jgi:hypothetical protein
VGADAAPTELTARIDFAPGVTPAHACVHASLPVQPPPPKMAAGALFLISVNDGTDFVGGNVMRRH